MSQMLIIIGLIIAISLILDFTQRIQEAQRIADEAGVLQVEVDVLLAEQAALLEERDYVQSDEYVEAWAHNEGRYVRNGEVLVIPIVPDDDNPARSTPVANIPPPPLVSWEMWLALFFE